MGPMPMGKSSHFCQGLKDFGSKASVITICLAQCSEMSPPKGTEKKKNYTYAVHPYSKFINFQPVLPTFFKVFMQLARRVRALILQFLYLMNF